jgi:hypothetical protein
MPIGMVIDGQLTEAALKKPMNLVRLKNAIFLIENGEELENV